MLDFGQLLASPQIQALGQLASLLLARILPLVTWSPMLGGAAVPRTLRTAFLLVLVMALLPSAAAASELRVLPAPVMVALLAKEALWGMTLAYMVTLLHQTLATMGSLADLSRGTTMANVLDPVTQQQESLLGAFFMQAVITLFFTVGAFRIVISALADSLVLMPLQAFVPDAAMGPAAIPAILDPVSQMLQLSLRLAAPVMAVMVLLDVVLALVNRVSPQVQVYFVGLTIKGTLALVVILLGLALTVDLVGGHMMDSLARRLQPAAGAAAASGVDANRR